MTHPAAYHAGFHGPGKYDGSIVNWVNGPLLQLAGNRRGFDVQITPFSGAGRGKRQDSRCSGKGLSTVLLPTTVVGSYSVPEWLERLKTDFYQRRIGAQHLKEIHDVAIKAALKDQELAGLDIVSDGELRRDNDIDYLLARIPGVDIPHRAKTDYYDYYDAQVTRPLPEPGTIAPGLAADFAFTRAHTSKPIKFSFTGPFSLSRRIRDTAYADPADLVRAIARWLNSQAAELAAAGAELLQIDEPFLAGYPEAADLAVEAVNTVISGVDGGTGRCTCATETATRGRCGKGTMTSLPCRAIRAGRPAGARVRPQGP